jgi:hypothetical protein
MRGTQPNRNVRFSCRYRGKSRRSVDIAKTTRMTRSRHQPRASDVSLFVVCRASNSTGSDASVRQNRPAENACPLTRQRTDRRRQMAAACPALRPPSTSASSAKSWSLVRRRCWSWTRMAGYCFTTRGCATCLDTGKTSSTASTPVGSGTTSSSVPRSSRRCATAAGSF